MTDEKALNYFVRRKHLFGLSDRIQDAEDNAIEALNKQIPKKVITNYTVEKGSLARIRQCPNCGSFINNSGIEFYCFHCGQALDWSGV